MKKNGRIINALALALGLGSLVIGAGLMNGPVSALTYQDEVDLEFVLNPTISINVSDDLTINDLLPGNYGDSNIITVSASSNAVAGYKVYSTVGSSTYASTELKKDGTDNTNKFTSIATSKATLADFSDSNWGYAWCSGTCATESTWVSGDAGSTVSGYNGLPLYTGTGVKVVDANAPGSSNVSFKIGARAASAQVAGTYNNVINFVAVANPNPEPPMTMQDFAAGATSTTCSSMSIGDTLTLTDNRDDTSYTVGKLAGGKCWMLENLSLDLVANKNNLNESNTNASNTTLGYLKNGGGSGQYTGTAVAYAGSSNTYNTPLIAVSGTCNDAYCVNDPASGQWRSSSVTQATINGTTSIAQGKIGAYYNYCAASAGSYCYASGSGTGNASEDICPKGWRLPTGGSSGEFNNLYSQYSGGSPSQVAAFQTALVTPLSGNFRSGTARDQGNRSLFWSSTYSNGYGMHLLRVNSSDVNPSSNDGRHYGGSIRCVLSS